MKIIDDSRIPIFASVTSDKIIEYIELEHFVSVFQELYEGGEIERCYYSKNKIVALEKDGDEMSDII